MKKSDAIDLSNGTFASVKRAIETAVQRHCGEIWKLLDASQTKPSAQLLIAVKSIDDMRLLHVSTPNIRTLDSVEFIGFGSELAIYKANQYKLKNVPVAVAAPLLAHIVDVVKENSQYCGRLTDLAILHPDGTVEYKTQDCITKTTQGYRSIEWLFETWIFPFLPLFVKPDGEDALSMIGALGEPKPEWTEKIPGILKFLADRRKSVLAGEIPSAPDNHQQKVALAGIPLAATMILNSSRQLYEERLITEKSHKSITARYSTIQDLGNLLSTSATKGELDQETITESLERLCLLLTHQRAPTKRLVFELSTDPQ